MNRQAPLCEAGNPKLAPWLYALARLASTIYLLLQYFALGHKALLKGVFHGLTGHGSTHTLLNLFRHTPVYFLNNQLLLLLCSLPADIYNQSHSTLMCAKVVSLTDLPGTTPLSQPCVGLVAMAARHALLNVHLHRNAAVTHMGYVAQIHVHGIALHEDWWKRRRTAGVQLPQQGPPRAHRLMRNWS